jgi:TOMM system kinase/cyclase fusion protein
MSSPQLPIPTRDRAERAAETASSHTIAGYRLLEPLGQGGFARVFRAEHEHTRRVVALKLLHFDAVFDEVHRERHRSRFWRETALCADLHHPNIVGLLDRGETDDGELFAAYGFVPGETLAALLRRRGSLPAAEAGELLGQVLDALACAHASGVVHRDLKPDNIMVTQTGSRPHAVVLDFGIGALTEEARRDDYRNLTLTREALGTPAYAAPEQLRGAPPTPKSDIYAWALIFLECLTGEFAVHGDSIAEVLRRQLDPTEIALGAGLASTPLGALLRRALRKNVAERAGEPAKLHAELRQLNLDSMVGVLHGRVFDPRRADALAFTQEVKNPGADRWLGGERRQVTVLCCSLDARHESVSPAAQERLEAMQRDRLALCHDVFERFGGWVFGSLAGRMLAYFGYPEVRDDDARRAARAAVQAIARIESSFELGTELELEARMTLHTGPVILGHGGPSDGPTQATALRLAPSTPPYAVGATPTTARLLESDAELVVLAPRGEAGSLPLAIVRAKAVQKFDLLSRSGAEPILGRERELALLERAFHTDAGGAAIVLIAGDAGTGKSLLVEEFMVRVRARGASAYICRCHSEEQNSALAPMLDLLREVWELPSSLGHEGGVAILERQIHELGFDRAITLPVLASWLGRPIPAELAPPRESPSRQKALLFDVLERVLLATRGDSPGLLVLEDAHWADPTTLELLARIATRRASHRRMLVVTTRRSEETWPHEERVIRLGLAGLSSAHVNQLAERLLGAPLSAPALLKICDRTEGVPWFVQELLRMLNEEQLLVRDGATFTLDRQLDATAVPVTLRDALAARLARLGSVRDTATLAAALGRSFSSRVLAAVSEKPKAELEADLQLMLNRQVIVATEPGHDASGPQYSFRHALLREVAYESLLPSARARVHGRVADVLDRAFPDIVRTAPAQFARHLALAGRFAQAVTHGTEAAEATLGRAANAEARAQAEAVLGWARSLPEVERATAELRANGVLTQALMAIRGWADPEVKACVDLSTRLLERRPDPELQIRTRWALLTYHYVASHRAELSRLAREFSEMADLGGDRSVLIAARTFGGLVAHGAGDYQNAERGLSDARALYEPELHRHHGRTFGLDSWAWSTATLALVRWFCGDASSAYRLADEAVAWARTIDHMPSLGITLLYAANLHHYAKDKTRVAEYASELLALDDRYGFPAYRAYAALLGAWATGDRTSGPVIVTQLRGMGCTAALSYYASLAAESAAEQGDHRAASEQFSACIRLCAAHEERYYEAELHYLHAHSLFQLGEARAALDALERAQRLSQEQAVSWVEHRATRELAKHGSVRAPQFDSLA